MTTENLAAVGGGKPAANRPEPLRYGVVFFLTVALVVFVIAAPNAHWSRAVALAIEGAALVVATATGRACKHVRYRRAIGAGVAIVLVIAGVWSRDHLGPTEFPGDRIRHGAVPVVIVSGLLRLLRERGVTLQAVAGALAIYLSIGLVFAAIISFIAQMDNGCFIVDPLE